MTHQVASGALLFFRFNGGDSGIVTWDKYCTVTAAD